MLEAHRKGAKGAVPACRVWSDAWNLVLSIRDERRLTSIREFDRLFQGEQSLFNWIQDYDRELWNAGLDDPSFVPVRISVCREIMARFDFGKNDQLMVENLRRSLAESHYELGECEKSYELYQGWLHEDPQWGWGWIGWADCYFFRPKEAEVNLKRAEEILRQGLAIDNVRDRCDILDRLIGVLDDTGGMLRISEVMSCLNQKKKHGCLLMNTLSSNDILNCVTSILTAGSLLCPGRA